MNRDNILNFLKQMNAVFLLMTLLVFGGGTASQQALAAGIDLSKVKPLTPIEFMPKEAFAEKTKLVEETPHEDNFLAYKVQIPNAWQKTEVVSGKSFGQDRNLSQRVLGAVSRYISPPKQAVRSSFTVEALELTYEIGARNWFINYVLSNGLTLNQVGTETEKQVEALYVKVEGDITYIVRSKAILNGPRIVVASYAVPQELYDEERVQQAQVISSFELLNREEVGVEKLKVQGFGAESFFDYPVSWDLRKPSITNMSRMSSKLSYSTVKGRLGGQINIYLTAKVTEPKRSEVIKYYKNDKSKIFELSTHEIGALLESPKMQYHDDMSFGVTQVYAMNSIGNRMINYELWVSVLESDDYIYVLTLLTPARMEEFYNWSRNVEAYRLIVRGMRREDESVDYYQFIE